MAPSLLVLRTRVRTDNNDSAREEEISANNFEFCVRRDTITLAWLRFTSSNSFYWKLNKKFSIILIRSWPTYTNLLHTVHPASYNVDIYSISLLLQVVIYADVKIY